MLKKTSIAAAVAGLALVGAPSLSQAFDYSILSGPIKFEFGNLDSGTTGYENSYTPPPNEQVLCTTVAGCDALAGITPAPGAIGSEDTWGIFSISRIVSDDLASATLWSEGDNGEYLEGIFYGLADYEVGIATIFGDIYAQIFAAGGSLDIYLNTSPEYSANTGPTGRTGLTTYPDITSGDLWLSADFVPGAEAGNNTAEYKTQYDTASLNGSGEAFLDVTGGSAASYLDRNAFPTLIGTNADLYLTTTYDNATGAQAAWTVSSVGQVKAVAGVPEPTTITLLGASLLAMGGVLRRRKAAV